MSIENTSNNIIAATKKLHNIVTSFDTEFGEIGSPEKAQKIRKLFEKYGLSNPPKTVEYSTMDENAKPDFFLELLPIVFRALSIEAVYKELVSINPGNGAFGSLANVKIWVLANIGVNGELTLLGKAINEDCDVLFAVRKKLGTFIADGTLKTLSDTITAFRDEVTIQVPGLGNN